MAVAGLVRTDDTAFVNILTRYSRRGIQWIGDRRASSIRRARGIARGPNSIPVVEEI